VPQLKYEDMEGRWLLSKSWSQHKAVRRHRHSRRSGKQVAQLERLKASQSKALEELRAESEDLYEAAIRVDYGYIPYEINGPVDTPPFKKYESVFGLAIVNGIVYVQ